MGYGIVARVFHWLTVLLVLIMIPVGLIMTQDLPRTIQDPLFILHKGLGPFVLLVVALRLVWRGFNPPPPLPASVPAAAAAGGARWCTGGSTRCCSRWRSAAMSG